MGFFGGGGGLTSGLIMGGFLCVGLFLLGIAAAVILSLISTFTPNHSSQGNGDEYCVNSMMLKLLYSDPTGTTFTNGSISPTQTFADAICNSILSQTNVAGCVVTAANGYGAYNDSTADRRRRRSTTSAGLYTIATMRLFYSTPCTKTADDYKYSSSSSLSSCVKTRLQACNSAFYPTGTGLNSVSTTAYGLSIVSTASTFSTYIGINVFNTLVVKQSTSVPLATNLGLSSSVKSALTLGCQYCGQVSQSYIASQLAQTVTTTAQTSTNNPSG